MKLKNFRHIMRAQDSIENAIMVGRAGGQRRRGKPRRSELDDVNDSNAPTTEDFTDNSRQKDVWGCRQLYPPGVEGNLIEHTDTCIFMGFFNFHTYYYLFFGYKVYGVITVFGNLAQSEKHKFYINIYWISGKFL